MNLIKVSLYIFSSFLFPTYQEYYQNLIVFCDLPTSTLQTIVQSCNQLRLCFENISIPILNENLSLSSSAWISKIMKMTSDTSSVSPIWSPFVFNIKSIFNFFQDGETNQSIMKLNYHYQCLHIRNLLAPSVTVIRKLFITLDQVRKWWKATINENLNIGVFAIAFLCSNRIFQDFPEDILDLFPKVLKIIILQSLYYFRNDLNTLQNFCNDFHKTQIQHCGSCGYNEFGWSLCSEDSCSSTCCCCSNGNNNSNSNSSQNTNNCVCLHLKKSFVSTINHSNISTQILTLLGREDFIANRDFITPKLNSPYQVMDNCLLSTFPSLLQGFQLKEEEQIHGKNDSLWNESQFSNLNTLKNSLNTLDDSDGLVTVEKKSLSRFSEDERMHEVCRLLRSSKTLYLKVERFVVSIYYY